MRFVLIAVLALNLCACSVKVEDQRASREELAAAFQERDKALEGLARVIQQHQARLDDIKPLPKQTAKK